MQNAWDMSEKAQLEDLTWRKYLGAVPLISFSGTVMLDGQAKDLILASTRTYKEGQTLRKPRAGPACKQDSAGWT